MHVITGQILKQMFLSAANNLYNHYPEVDALNVFPVPDGDTGINMNLTLTSGAKEISNMQETDVYSIAKAFSHGLLNGARGNSGVITSQIFRGFAKSLEGKTEIKPHDLALAFAQAKETSYKKVQRPVEGTILTIIRESSDTLMQKGDHSSTIEECFKILLDEARASLKRTPELLPVLKEVGVVDSGAAGLVYIFEGMYKAIIDQFVERNTEGKTIVEEAVEKEEYSYKLSLVFDIYTDGSKKQFIEQNFKDFIQHNGRNLVMQYENDTKINIKVITQFPGTILAYLQKYGEFSKIDIITKAQKEYDADENENVEMKDNALIAVSSGEGINELFKEAGVDYIVFGGQTMNPSIQDFVDAIKKVHAKNVIILPNNSNIVMAANQASELIEGICDVRVVPSTSIPQGIACAMNYVASERIDTNFMNMKSALRNITTGSVTYAIKDTDIDGVHIVKDYYLGLKNKDIITCVKDRDEALANLFASMINDKSSSATIICGADVSLEDQNKISEQLSNAYQNVAITVIDGKQPVYSFLIGVE